MWNIVVFDCMCNTQKILCYWTNTTGMTHLKITRAVTPSGIEVRRIMVLSAAKAAVILSLTLTKWFLQYENVLLWSCVCQQRAYVYYRLESISMTCFFHFNACNVYVYILLFQLTNAQIYIYIYITFFLYIMLTPTCFDISQSPSGSFKNLYFAKLRKLCISYVT